MAQAVHEEVAITAQEHIKVGFNYWSPLVQELGLLSI